MISQKYIEDSFGKEEQIQGIISEVNFGYTTMLEVYPPGRINPQLNAGINKLVEMLTSERNIKKYEIINGGKNANRKHL